MSASKVLVGAVCLPKYLSPPPNHLVHAVYLYSLFLKIHTCTCTHLHIHSPAAICRLSAARGVHGRMCSRPFHLLPSGIPRLHAQRRRTSTHLHISECTHMCTCTRSLCTYAQEVQVHRMCVLIGSPHMQTCICLARIMPVHAHVSTQVLTCMLGRVRDSGGPFASSTVDSIPSSFWY